MTSTTVQMATETTVVQVVDGEATVVQTGVPVTVTTTGGGGGVTDATYVTLSTNGTLTDERVLTAGTGITITDAGAGSTVTVGVTANTYQPLDSDLTAIAALSTTSFGRALLELADAAAGRTARGLGSLATASTITTSEITDGTIVNADISASAAIAGTKVDAATDTVRGTVELATTTEATTGTDTSLAVTPAGLKAARPAMVRPKTGSNISWGWLGGSAIPQTTTFAIGANTDWFWPFRVDRTVTMTDLAVVTTTSAAGKTAWLGIFTADTDMQPASIVAQSTVDLTSSGTLSWAANQSLTPGWYLAGLNHDSTATFRAWYTDVGAFLNPSNLAQNIANFTKTRTAATWGSVPTWDTFGTGSPTGTSDGFAPFMVMRWTPS